MIEPSHQTLRNGEREYQLWSDGDDFWRRPFEEGPEALLLGNVLHDFDAALISEGAALNPRLYHV